MISKIKNQNQTNKEGKHIKDVKVKPSNNTQRKKLLLLVTPWLNI